MKFLILTGNPKSDGLCHSVEDSIQKGAVDGGAEVEVLSVEKLGRCRVCGEGWGICREGNACAFGKDGFDEAQKAVRGADLYCLVTPVYWSEMAEGLKCFLDRLRRCEFGGGALAGKPVLLVASPGGTGNGMLNCLQQMQRFCQHTGAAVFDFVGVNRWNNDYKREAAYAAAKAMAEGRRPDDTI